MPQVRKKYSPRGRASAITMCAAHLFAATSKALRAPAMKTVSYSRETKMNRIHCGSFRGSLRMAQKVPVAESLGRRVLTQLFHSQSKSAWQDPSAGKNSGADASSPFTVRQAYEYSLKKLEQQGVSEPDWSVAHLLSNALDLPWSNGFSLLQRALESNLSSDKELSEQLLTKSQWEHYESMVERRLENEPLQYILGKWDFLDYDEIVIRPPLLCPRPETEELIELVRKDIQKLQSASVEVVQTVNVLDVGCGTGVIGIALADKIISSKVCAIDIEPIAVMTSLENAEKILGPDFGERYSVVECTASNYKTENNNRIFDAVVSNPPYIPRDDMETLAPDVIQYESDQALCGGDDGMDIIRQIIRKWALEWGKPLTSTCWMEVDPTHPALLQSWLDQDEQRRTLGVFLESTHQDMSGKDRFVKLSFR